MNTNVTINSLGAYTVKNVTYTFKIAYCIVTTLYEFIELAQIFENLFLFIWLDDQYINNSSALQNIIEPRHETSNNVVSATSKGSDQPAHTCSLIRAFASRLNIL